MPEGAKFLARHTLQLNGYYGLLPAPWSINIGIALYGTGSNVWTDALEPRVAQVARVSWKGIEFLLVNVHLPLAQSLRNKSLVLLQNNICGENVVLVGDFNAKANDLFLNDLVLAEGLNLAGTGEATHASGRRLDYIMFRGGFRQTGYELKSGLSDHGLLQTTLEV